MGFHVVVFMKAFPLANVSISNVGLILKELT